MSGPEQFATIRRSRITTQRRRPTYCTRINDIVCRKRPLLTNGTATAAARSANQSDYVSHWRPRNSASDCVATNDLSLRSHYALEPTAQLIQFLPPVYFAVIALSIPDHVLLSYSCLSLEDSPARRLCNKEAVHCHQDRN